MREIEEFAITTGLPAMTPNSIISLEELNNGGNRTKYSGYVMSDEDVTIGISAIGAPVRDYSGAVVGAISIGGIAQILRMKKEEYSIAIMKSAMLISTQMGLNDVNSCEPDN